MRFVLFLLVMLGLKAWSYDEKKYPVSAIPDTLKKGVDAVFREDHMKFTIHARDKSTLYVHVVITIMNENGNEHAEEIIGYDKLSKVNMFKGASYEADGTLIKRLKVGEIYDQSSFDGYSLYSDNRLKHASLTYGSYPYTVEFEYEIEYKSLFGIPDFRVVGDERISVQNSSYELIYPVELKPKFKAYRITSAPVIRTSEGKESTKWTFANILPMKFDLMGPSRDKLIPYIAASANLFEYDGFQGSAKTWDDYTTWQYALLKNRDVLPTETINKVKELTQNLKTDEEKIKAVYEYLQSRTRYVSIQLGIGGWQPFEASLVDKVGYGDCKALSNYMVSMLKSIGIKANYTLITSSSNNDYLNEEMIGPQFNHAVVHVPNGKDTIWLECTSQSIPFGYMGSSTGNRKALAITERGAKFVSSPKYPAEVNVQARKASVKVLENGYASAVVSTRYSGLKYEERGLFGVLDNNFDDQKKWIENTTDIPAFNINSFKIENHKARIPTAIVKLDLQLDRYAQVNGKRMFLSPNLMSKSRFLPTKMENRKSPVVIRQGFVHVDTIQFSIPDNIYPEGLPEGKKFNAKFGEYESSYTLEQGKLTYIRRFKYKEGTYPPETYNELVDFFKNINKADNTKVVFVNKT